MYDSPGFCFVPDQFSSLYLWSSVVHPDSAQPIDRCPSDPRCFLPHKEPVGIQPSGILCLVSLSTQALDMTSLGAQSELLSGILPGLNLSGVRLHNTSLRLSDHIALPVCQFCQMGSFHHLLANRTSRVRLIVMLIATTLGPTTSRRCRRHGPSSRTYLWKISAK